MSLSSQSFPTVLSVITCLQIVAERHNIRRQHLSFVGKKQQLSFVGKKQQLSFVGKKQDVSFVGKKNRQKCKEALA